MIMCLPRRQVGPSAVSHCIAAWMLIRGSSQRRVLLCRSCASGLCELVLLGHVVLVNHGRGGGWEQESQDRGEPNDKSQVTNLPERVETSPLLSAPFRGCGHATDPQVAGWRAHSCRRSSLRRSGTFHSKNSRGSPARRMAARFEVGMRADATRFLKIGLSFCLLGCGSAADEETSAMSTGEAGSAANASATNASATNTPDADVATGAAGSATQAATARAGASAGSTSSTAAVSGTAGQGSDAAQGGTAAAGTGGAAAEGSAGTDATDAGTDSGMPTDSAPVPTEHFSFFVTSIEAIRELSGSEDGFGGDLRYGESTGLAGADKICTEIAESSMAGSGAKVWRAFLSASAAGPNGEAVNARDRIGTGPWYDRVGRLVAMDLTSLLGTRPAADSEIANDLPNERGEPNRGMSDVDNHDTVTGSDEQGRYSGGVTCNDWTSTETSSTTSSGGGRPGGGNGPMCGHSWPAQSGQSWVASHGCPSCAPGVNLVNSRGGGGSGIGGSGGYGGFYCFALSP